MNNIYLHSYCNNNGYLHNYFNLIDVGIFGVECVKLTLYAISHWLMLMLLGCFYFLVLMYTEPMSVDECLL